MWSEQIQCFSMPSDFGGIVFVNRLNLFVVFSDYMGESAFKKNEGGDTDDV
jgi:hypothetical protein